MATLNTRNVHRSNMLVGFPYGTDFVYDEMVLTGPGEAAKLPPRRWSPPISASRPAAPNSGEGPTKEERESGSCDYFMSRSRQMAAACAPRLRS
jgi:hypothetical protein